MIKSLIAIIRIFWITSIHSIKSVKRIKKFGRNSYFNLSRLWSKKLLNIADLKLNVSGQEFIDKKKQYLIIANHSSYFDIPILLYSIPLDFIIIYKESLEKTPIFGKSLKYSPFLPINRESPRKAMKTLIATKEVIENKNSVLIFPEGTRSKDGKLGDFKQGALTIARINNLEILPVTIDGSFKILPQGSAKIQLGENVKVHIHKPKKYDGGDNFLNNIKEIINQGIK